MIKIKYIFTKSGTNIASGVKLGLDELRANSKNKQKLMILLTDGEGEYNKSYNDIAKADKVKIYTVALGSSTDEALLKDISTSTGGEFYKATTSLDLVKTFEQVRDDSLIDATDTDEDGIPDVVEINGMKTLNGDVIKTDPNNIDTDGDFLTDGEEMGEPVTYKVPDEYKQYIDSYTYYPMYSNPLIDNSVSEEDEDTESKGEIADYIPGTAKFFLDKSGINYNEIANSLDNIDSTSVKFNLGTKEDYKAIAAGVISGIDDSLLFGVIQYFMPFEEPYGENIEYWKARTVVNCAFTIKFGAIFGVAAGTLIADGAIMAGTAPIPGLNGIVVIVGGTIAIPAVAVAAVSLPMAVNAGYKTAKSGSELIRRLDELSNEVDGIFRPISTNSNTIKDPLQLRRTYEVNGTKIEMQSGHSFNRPHKGGLVSDIATMDKAESAVIRDVIDRIKNGSLKIPHSGTLEIELNGKTLLYRAVWVEKLKTYSINYFPKK